MGVTANEQTIERPVFGTREWANYNENCISGCHHDCKYCYAKSMAIRFKRKTPNNWNDEVLDRTKLKKVFRKKEGRFMFPTTHDITPENIDHCMSFLENVLKPGNEVLVVSKPHLECIKLLCRRFKDYKQPILFRFTIGSTNNETLRFWDQNAPDFDNRFESLQYAFRSGFATSVSCEPLLDNNADELISRLLPFTTDAIWIGKVNYMISRLNINGHKDQETMTRAAKLMDDLSDDFIINLYQRHRGNAKIKWKESIKKVVGIEIPVKTLDM